MRSTVLVETSDARITRDMLAQVFGVYGRVNGVDLVEGQDFGFVRMSNEVTAKKAIAALNGQSCAGITLNMRSAHKGTDHELRQAGNEPEELNGR